MKFPLFSLLKVLAGLCVSFLFLPVLMALGNGLGVEGESLFWTYFLVILLLCGLLGILYKTLLYPKILKSCGPGLVLANLLSLGLALGAGWLAAESWAYVPMPLLSYPWTGTAFYYAVWAVSAGSFFGGSIAFEKNYGDILTRPYFLFLTIADAVCLMVTFFTKRQLGATLLAVCYLIAAGVYALTQSQSGIDFMMNRRKHDLRHLPRKMRWYSLGLVSGGFLIIVAAFLFRKQIAAFFVLLWELFRSGVGYLLRLLPDNQGEPPVAEEPPPGEPAGLGPLLPEAGEPSFFWTIFGYLILALFLFLIYYYRREIFSAFRSLGRKIAALFQKLLLRRGGRVLSQKLEGDYEDDVEDLPRVPAETFSKKPKPYDARRWKKDYKAYCALEAGPKKVREGYRLALLYLLLKGVPLTPADTPEEILKKAGDRLPAPLFQSVTQVYRRVRYGEEELSEGADYAALLENCLKACANGR